MTNSSHRKIRIQRWLRDKFGWLPLFGGLTRCSGTDHFKAGKELLITLFFSTTTFWLAALLIWLTKKGQVMSYWYHLRTTVENGELTIFAVSLLGPILFLALDDVPENADSPGRTKEFPGKISHMFVVVVLCLLCGALYAGIKVGTDFEQSALFVTSFYIAVAAVTLRYLATAYRKETLRPDEDWKADEEDFVEQFKKR